MWWIPILVVAYNISKNVLSVRFYLHVFAEIIKFKAHGHGLQYSILVKKTSQKTCSEN